MKLIPVLDFDFLRERLRVGVANSFLYVFISTSRRRCEFRRARRSRKQIDRRKHKPPWAIVWFCKLLARRTLKAPSPTKSGMIVRRPATETGPQHSTHHVVMQASSSEPNTILNHGALSNAGVQSSVALPQIENIRLTKSQHRLRRDTS